MRFLIYADDGHGRRKGAFGPLSHTTLAEGVPASRYDRVEEQQLAYGASVILVDGFRVRRHLINLTSRLYAC